MEHFTKWGIYRDGTSCGTNIIIKVNFSWAAPFAAKNPSL